MHFQKAKYNQKIKLNFEINIYFFIILNLRILYLSTHKDNLQFAMGKSANQQNNNASIHFIKTKCEQIKDKPSQLNNLNSVIQKYLDLQIPSTNVELYAEKLNSLISICQLVQSLLKATKANKNKNQTIINFLQQKASILIQILVNSQIQASLQNQQEFQIVAQNIAQILVILNNCLPVTLADKFVEKWILQPTKKQGTNLNVKLITKLYQNFRNGSLLSSILTQLKKRLSIVDSIQDKKVVQALAAFMSSLPTFDLIQIGQQNSSAVKQKSFEEGIQQQKPKTQFKRLFQSVFLNLLAIIQSHRQIAVGLYRKLDSRILSKMSNPSILSDYFLNKFKQDPEIQIQVLSCLFILVGKYGLEFQNFYPQLEELIKQKKDGKSVYQMKNSKRFFKLVQSALKSSKVPFKTIQTMSRVIMSQIIEQQSQFSFWALPLFFNLTKKHRKLLDIFKEIPQIQLLSRHYNPKIRALVNEFKRDLNKAEYLQIQKFAKIDCKKLTEKKVEELTIKLNQQQQAEFKIPGLFEDL